ncbi:MAG: hypothetical protein U0401_21605 [Anaerolineae bacterium]
MNAFGIAINGIVGGIECYGYSPEPNTHNPLIVAINSLAAIINSADSAISITQDYDGDINISGCANSPDQQISPAT